MAIRQPDGPDGPIDPLPRPRPRPQPEDPVDPRDPVDPVDPPPPEEPVSAFPLNPSITSWTRLEPQCRDADMRRTLAARVFDPLWLLARQWQVGEFQGEDAGMPVLARVRATTAMLSRCHLGALPANSRVAGAAYDPRRMPLETMVERQPLKPRAVDDVRMLRFSVEAGLHFLRMLEDEPLSKNYRSAFIARFAMQPLDDAQLEAADEQTARFAQTMAKRAPDGRRLADAVRRGTSEMVADSALGIAVADRAEVEQTAQRWLAWYDSVFTEPDSPADDAWLPSRLEYATTVAARLSEQPGQEKALTASEFYDGHLDWSSFDLDAEVSLGTDADRTFSAIMETTVPAPVTFRGAPAPRYWEFEDGQIEYGLLPAGPTDLAQLLMIEYAGSYGNDWFVVPLSLPVGSLTTVNSLVVTDSFGVRFLVRPIGDRALPRPHWSMYQLGYLQRPGADRIPGAEPNLFFLPPALGRSLEGAAIEDVLFMRDEMANLAWAIERTIESPIEQPTPRADPDGAAASNGGALEVADGPGRYLLSSTVPSNWIPLLPVQLKLSGGRVASRLKRGAVLQPDGSQKIHRARGRALNAASELVLYDEEVPREGIRVTRHHQMARWIDGSTWTWVAYRKQVGRGEGSSGLQFDSIEAEAAG